MRKILLGITLLSLITAGASHAAPLTLGDCLARAASGNRALKTRAFDEAIAAQSVTLANSAFYPRIDFQGGYTSQLAEQKIQLNATSIATQDANFGFFSFTLNYILYDFGRRDARSHHYELLQEATSDLYRGQEKELYLLGVKGYYGILQAK